MRRNQLFAAGATAAVLLALALGFHQVGSPGLQRLAKADETRIEDLNRISEAVFRHRSAYGKLPDNLSELGGSGPLLRLTDPDTKTAYDYRTLDERRFELCVVFSTDNRAEVRRPPRERLHGAGRQCFTYPE